jgi:pyruvate dehydrogenase E1 component alpha subunit
MRFAKKYCVENGPLFVEFNTYRYHGHSMSDPGLTYRTRDEVQETRKTRDPIEFVKKVILDNKLVDEAHLKAIDKRVRSEIDAIVKQAQADPMPDPNVDLYTHVLSGIDPYIRGVRIEESRNL